MVANSIGLNNMNIDVVAGLHALLPNQPIIHNAVVTPTQDAATPLAQGAIVALSDDVNMDDCVVVKQAAVTDTPFGVVAYANIQTGYAANDRVSVYPAGSYVYLPAGTAGITRGAKLQFNADNQVVATSTADNGYIGVALTQSAVTGDLIVVRIEPGMA